MRPFHKNESHFEGVAWVGYYSKRLFLGGGGGGLNSKKFELLICNLSFPFLFSIMMS